MSIQSAIASWFAPWDIEEKAAPTPGGDILPNAGTGWSQYPFLLPSSRLDYRQEAGDVSQNAIVAACLQWVARTFPEAPIRHMRRTNGEEQPLDTSPLIQLLAQPNEYYSGLMLWAATLWSLNIDGNAYWLKVRRQNGRTAELWYEPHTTCRPVWPSDGSVFISGYQVLRRGYWSDVIPRKDIVHYRALGLDPLNPRKGLSPLAAALREIFTDNEAANFSASLLRNMGVPGVVVSPKGPDATIDNPEEIKDTLTAKFSGDRRGEVAVMTGPTEMQVLSWSPEQMNLEKLRNIPEERITALLGVPAIVAGLGAGLDHCIIGNVRIATANRGPVRADEVRAGDSVWAVRDGQMDAYPVSWAGSTGYRAVYSVKTPGRTITATDNHPFLVRRMEKVPAPLTGRRNSPEWRYWLEWAPLRDLRVGDYIVRATALPDVGCTALPDGQRATEPLMEWIGAYIGDGSVSQGNVQMSIPSNDRVRAYYEQLTRPLFTKYRAGGERPWKRAKDDWTEAMVARYQAGESYRAIARDYPIRDASVRDRVQTALHPKPVETAPITIRDVRNGFAFVSAETVRWIDALGIGRGARNKCIPGWVFRLAAPLRLALLRGLLDTDGTVDKRGHAVFCFASENLTHGVWHLALSLGMSVSNIYYRQMSGAALPNPCTQEAFDAWTFTLTSHEDVRRIGTHDAKYAAYLEAVSAKSRNVGAGGHPKSRTILPEHCAFALVQTIEPAGEAFVYDLTVPEAHCFIADGLVIHNSTFHNFGEAKASAYENNLIPTQRLVAAQLNTDLVPEFADPKREWVEFDNSEVLALSEDQTELVTRMGIGYEKGIFKRSEAREAVNMGLESGPEDDVYFTDLPKITERLSETETPADPGATPFPELNPLPAEPVPANGKT